jgi:hypothetical protein
LSVAPTRALRYAQASMATSAEATRRDRFAALSLAVLLIGGATGLILQSARRDYSRAPAAAAPDARQAVLFDRFAARRERGESSDALAISLRLRTAAEVSLPCFVFLVARNDRASPRQWAIWPEQPPGPAITARGHFHAATPTAGTAVTLSDGWTRLRATIPNLSASTEFDHVVLYVVDPSGRIVLTRPFRL